MFAPVRETFDGPQLTYDFDCFGQSIKADVGWWPAISHDMLVEVLA
jgi:hypothetical protein